MKVSKMKTSHSRDVAEIHTRSWQYAYKNIISKEFLDSIDVHKREKNWSKGIIDHPSVIRLVIEEDLQILGFACGLENRFKNIVPECEGELWAIYLNPNQTRKGAGTKLFEEFGNILKQKNMLSFCVWVLEKNLIARSFYEKIGGKISDARKTFEIDSQKLDEVCYTFRIDR